PWRGQVRRVRMVVYRRASASGASRRGQSPEQALTTICDRLAGGPAHAGVKARRTEAASIHDRLLRRFNPHPTTLRPDADERARCSATPPHPERAAKGKTKLAGGASAHPLSWGNPVRVGANRTWLFHGRPHRLSVMHR